MEIVIRTYLVLVLFCFDEDVAVVVTDLQHIRWHIIHACKKSFLLNNSTRYSPPPLEVL